MTIPALAAAAAPQTALLVGWITTVVAVVLLAAVAFGLARYFLRLMAARKHIPAPAESPAEAPAEPLTPAPGSAGQLKLHDVEPKTAAMLMAIVADKTGKPLNQLRFISIKEVK